MDSFCNSSEFRGIVSHKAVSDMAGRSWLHCCELLGPAAGMCINHMPEPPWWFYITEAFVQGHKEGAYY
jgi:hypothetical protein